jgi:ABC-2 type transport system permease protein
MNALTKAFAFFAKEFHDIRRQPRLLISLVGGPLLVLAAFGATFRSANPAVTAVLVWPRDGIPGISQEEAAAFVGANFNLAKVTTDEQEAIRMLENAGADVVQVIPSFDFTPGSGKPRPEIRIVSRTVDPNTEAWIRSVAYAETNYINQRLLAVEADQAQARAREVSLSLDGFRSELAQVSANINPQQIERAQKLAGGLRELLTGLLAALPAAGSAPASLAPELNDVRDAATRLLYDIDELDRVLARGEVATQLERLQSAISDIDSLRITVNVFVETPAEELIAPVKQSYTNLRGSPFSMVVFYAPAVLALLVQQLAITLASLGVVRERQMGAFEMFRVSPLGLSQILLGKSIAFILFVVVAGIVLRVLMALLGVPTPAHPIQYLVLMILLAVASVGVGLFVSAISRTDAQAIQFTMLALLLSVFFTGFFLPITGFAWPAKVISALLPMTHAMKGFRELSLSGGTLDTVVWVSLVLIAVLAYGLAVILLRRQYRKVMD